MAREYGNYKRDFSRIMNASADARAVKREPVAGAISPCRLELQHHLPGAVHTQAFIGNCRASEVAAQLFEPLPIIGCATHACVQVEAMCVGAQRPAGFVVDGRTARGELQAEHLLARTRAVRDAIGRGGRLQRHHQVIWIGEAARNTIAPASSIRCPKRVSNRNIRAMILPSRVCSAAWLGETAGWKMCGDVIASGVPVGSWLPDGQTPTEHQRKQMNVQIGRGAETLDQGDGTGGGLRTRDAGLFAQKRGNHSMNDLQ